MIPTDGSPALTLCEQGSNSWVRVGSGGLNNQEWPHCGVMSESEFPALVI